MQGKIIKGIAGFYYVHIKKIGIVECKARGVFRNQNIKPIVGDNVEIEILDDMNLKGNIISVLPRANELNRPLVANIDQTLVVFSVALPEPNFYLLDRLLLVIEKAGILSKICFNKIDILEKEKVKKIVDIYHKIGYEIFITSTKQYEGIEELKKILYDKTTVLAGPSGVGKSSLLNVLQSVVKLETGEISNKLKRGKHTTRHAELINFQNRGYIVDTPGFSNIILNDIQKEDLQYYFIEFAKYIGGCKFQGCAHISEPNCAVKSAVERNEINKCRYESYNMIYEELKLQRRW